MTVTVGQAELPGASQRSFVRAPRKKFADWRSSAGNLFGETKWKSTSITGVRKVCLSLATP